MKVVMIADSESYSFVGSEKKMLSLRAEFEWNNEKMVEKYE